MTVAPVARLAARLVLLAVPPAPARLVVLQVALLLAAMPAGPPLLAAMPAGPPRLRAQRPVGLRELAPERPPAGLRLALVRVLAALILRWPRAGRALVPLRRPRRPRPIGRRTGARRWPVPIPASSTP